MDIRASSFNFPRTEGDAQAASQTLSFPREVRRIAVGITGYTAIFEGEDHHLGRLTVETSARIDPDDATKVIVSGTFRLRDWSGEFDDPYSGNIQWAVLVELVPPPPTAPGGRRADLIITGAEVSQSIQHFRSARHLDAANVLPDNSVRLVAGKPTAVRLYVDYDSTSGLPPITFLTGELLVTGASSPIPPLQSIRPRRDVSIDRRQLGHTLNFVIPEALCQGSVSLEARVFDATATTQSSQSLSRDLTFETMPELPIMAVGIEYTGADTKDNATAADLAAPQLSDFVDLFAFTERTYPIPAVAISSYQTITYDKDVESDISEGCDKLQDMKDEVADLRGDSNDIVYGLFNDGLNTGSVGGCGGNGVAVGRIGRQTTAAHEIGHALGRQHAPCDNVTRCAQPRNQDDDYPHYIGYDSDSIGEYGFDIAPTLGRVPDPANAHDFMGYSGNEWISPYSYKALMSRIPADFAGAGEPEFLYANGVPREFAVAPTVREDNEWIRVKTPQLFLRFNITRDREVCWWAAFHFESLPRPHGVEATDFILEQLDEDSRVLRSACLYAESTCCGYDCKRWPVRIRQAVPFDPSARTLALHECEKEIARWKIPPPPEVEVQCAGETDPDQPDITISWKAIAPENGADDGFWFLVQWRDRAGTWRGCAPRLQGRELRVPKNLFGGISTSLQIRVLASSGIATGVGIWEGECAHPRSDPKGEPPVDVVLQGISAAGIEIIELPAVLRVAAVRRGTTTSVRTQIHWYDEWGGEIGRGRSLDLRALPYGQSLVTAALLDRGEGSGQNQWLIERTIGDNFRLLRGTIGEKVR